jgi:hypothetical protein
MSSSLVTALVEVAGRWLRRSAAFCFPLFFADVLLSPLLEDFGAIGV